MIDLFKNLSCRYDEWLNIETELKFIPTKVVNITMENELDERPTNINKFNTELLKRSNVNKLFSISGYDANLQIQAG